MAMVSLVVLSACGGPVARVGTDAGPLDTVTQASRDPSAGATPPVTGEPSPPAAQGPDQPSAQPSTSPSAQPTDQPSDGPSAQPSDDPSSSPSDDPGDRPSDEPSEVEVQPPDLELAGWDLRVLGLIDPARADVLNVFAQRPVVVVLHALADTVVADEDDPPADDAAVIDVVEVRLDLDSGEVLESLPVFTGATTVECPAQVERRVILRAGQGQRLCAVFDVAGTAEVQSVLIGADGRETTVAAADVAQLSSIDEGDALDVGVPESTLALGEAVEVVVDTATGDATVEMAVTDAEVLDDDDGRLVGLTVELASPVDLADVRLEPEAIAALSPDGVQRTRLLDETASDCRGTATIDVPAGDVVSFCLPVLVPEDAITSHARFSTVLGPPQVWRVLRAGGTAGPGSNA